MRNTTIKFYITTSSLDNSCGKEFYILEDFYQSRPVRIYKDFSPTLRSNRTGLKVLEVWKDIKYK
jgi:hypothetical protein